MAASFDHDEAARQGMYASSYMIDAAYAQLIGLCRGILADAELRDSEIVTLNDWLDRYGVMLPEWPGQVLARRVRAVLQDGVIEPEERADLEDFLRRAACMEGGQGLETPTTLPLTDPPPHIDYDRKRFCLTGTFVYGPRRRVEAAIEEWGGTVVKSVVRAHFLVIGGTITPAWKYGTHGLKIEEAVGLAASGLPIAIVSEAHWSTSLC